MNTTTTTVRAADLEVGDILKRQDTGRRWDRRPQDRIPAITNVQTVVVDSRGETWDDFSLTFVTYANGHQAQFEADAQVEIITRASA